MIFDLLSQFWQTSDVEQVYTSFAEGKPVLVSGLRGSAASLYYVLLQRHLKIPVTLVARSVTAAEEYYRDCTYFERCFDPEGVKNRGTRIHYFPAYDSEPYQGVSAHPQITFLRMQALWRASKGEAGITIVPAETVLHWIAPPEVLARGMDSVSKNDARGPVELASRLRMLGFKEKDVVTSRGEFSLRGAILDFFSPAEEMPVRLEFFGNSIESMRLFESSSQRSVREISEATILSLRELQLSQQEIERWGRFAETRWTSEYYFEELADKTEQLIQNGYFDGYEEYTRAFFEKPATLLDYIGEDACIVLDEPATIRDTIEEQAQQYRKRYEQVHEHWKVALEPEEIFQDWDSFYAQAQKRFILRSQELVTESNPDETVFQYNFQSTRQYHGHIQEMVNDFLRLNEIGYTTYCVLPTLGKAERLSEIMREYNAPVLFFHDPFEDAVSAGEELTGKILIVSGELSRGFKNADNAVALFTEDDLFGESRPVIKSEPKRASQSFLSDLRDLKTDDYVVHVDHGIGQFKGLTAMFVEGKEREFLVLEFAEEDKLYVPVERLDLVQKYMGASDAAPRLDKLGSTVWVKAKKRAKASLKDMAEKLLQLYAHRKAVKGFSFSPDDSFQREFEEAFEFQETPHQLAAISDTKADMESDRPMDRLICGDVGYGKTEVAMRAAFKAINEGKQVAVLAPTTILVFQHYHTFRKRFEMFPVRIEMVSRFRNRAEIKKTLDDTREGKVEILIGTHRLLSRDVQFQDLGLLIIDEEQRFGVGHKEKLKEIRKSVDALTLTATPIPRTLQMALMGFRPMSVIETPPKDRLAIQTNIVKYEEDTIGAAVRAELKRGGQVYFVHNRVETIYSIASMIQQIVPEARVVVAHGQMAEGELEKVMMQFINHEFDVLVSTTIIENGIDIPLVNTLIVNRADRFGLSQLYQLRGRVGRSHRRAYAYFLIPSEKELTPVARKRLSALREFTELGSGFRLAALDLEIRGAGNLLGGEQHGHIAALGFELYCRMLEQTVKELQGEESPVDTSTNVNLNIEIRIPEDYIANMNQRLSLYKRIATASSLDQLQNIRDEMIDRYGAIPDSVENLFEYGRIKFRAEQMRIRSIDRSDGSLYFQLSEEGGIKHEAILSFIKRHKGSALSPAGVLSYKGEKLHIPENLFIIINQLLDELTHDPAAVVAAGKQ